MRWVSTFCLTLASRRSCRLIASPVTKTVNRENRGNAKNDQGRFLDALRHLLFNRFDLLRHIIDIKTGAQHPAPFFQSDRIADFVDNFLGRRFFPNNSDDSRRPLWRA